MDATLTRPTARVWQQLQLRPCHNLQSLVITSASTSGRATYLDAPIPSRLLTPARQTSLCRTQQQASKYTRGSRLICAAGHFQPYPFDEDDYYNVNMQVIVQESRTHDGVAGSLLLMRDADKLLGPGATCLVLGVGGDTLLSIASLAERKQTLRPMALDLLWQVLERGQEISKRDWRVVRVAIVELRQQTYIGRLFFGDDNGVVMWDCDCRPSDGCWLALKAKCPIYVRKSVWEQNSTPLKALVQEGSPAAAKLSAAEEATSGTDALTKIRGDEPEPLKRLKREMGVALHEEDYAAAARIRDHPYMLLHKRILEHRRNNRVDAARSMEQELEEMINQQGSPDRQGDM